jgi:hypothetical protein
MLGHADLTNVQILSVELRREESVHYKPRRQRFANVVQSQWLRTREKSVRFVCTILSFGIDCIRCEASLYIFDLWPVSQSVGKGVQGRDRHSPEWRPSEWLRGIWFQCL